MQPGVSLFGCAGCFASVMAGASVPLFSATAIAAASRPEVVQTVDPNAIHIVEAAKRFGLPADWISAVMSVESGGDPRALSRAGAIGLMQIMPGTWTDLAARYGLGNDPWNARANILAGAAYLRELLDRYADLPTALAAYNAGSGRVDALLARGRPLPAETVAYIARILPLIGKSSGNSSAVRPTDAASSWRTSTIFVPRNSDGAATSDEAERLPPIPNSPPSPRSTSITLQRARSDLFIPLSGF